MIITPEHNSVTRPRSPSRGTVALRTGQPATPREVHQGILTGPIYCVDSWPCNPAPRSARTPSPPRSARAGWARCIRRATPSSTGTWRSRCFEVNAPNGRYVRVYDREGNSPTRLTTGAGVYRTPLWSLDGQRVMFTYSVGGQRSWASRAFDGTGPVETLTRPPGVGAVSWSEDGRTLVVTLGEGGEDSVIGFPIGTGGQVTELIDPDFQELYPQVSPDGRWIAYTSDESGQFEVYVKPFPNVDNGRWPVSQGVVSHLYGHATEASCFSGL